MFVLKKVVSVFLMPYTFSFITILSGILLLWFSKRLKTGKILVTTGLLSFFIFSFSPFISPLLSDLETKSPMYDGSKVEYVVVLGGGHVTDPDRSVTSHLASQSLTRLCEGIRILNLNNGAKLVLSGWGGFHDKHPNSHVMKKVAVSLGVKPELIITEPNPRDTIEESYLIKKIVGEKKFALVTSAYHMRRASAIFRKRGLNFVSAPTFYYVMGKKYSFVPGPETLYKSHRLVSEYLGYIWAKIKNEG